MMNRRKNDPHDWQPFIIALGVTRLVGLATGTPYFYKIPHENMQLIIQAQTSLWGGWLIVLNWYFGSSKNQSKAQDTMNRQATALAASAPASPPSDKTITLPPGDSVSVEAASTDGDKP